MFRHPKNKKNEKKPILLNSYVVLNLFLIDIFLKKKLFIKKIIYCVKMEKIIKFIKNNTITDEISTRLYKNNINNYNIVKLLLINGLNYKNKKNNELPIYYCNNPDVYELLYNKEFKNIKDINKLINFFNNFLLNDLFNLHICDVDILIYILENNLYDINNIVICNDIEKFNILLKFKKILITDDYYYITNYDVIKILFSHNIKIPENILLYIDSPDLANIYLNLGININYIDDFKKNALFYAKNYDYIKFLLSKKINVHQKDIYNFTPLCCYLICHNDINVIDLYLSYGLNINQNTNKLFMRIVHYNIEYLDILIKKGLNLNIQNDDGNTLLHYILINNLYNDNESKLFIYLLKYININIQNNCGNTILHILCKNYFNDSIFKLYSFILIKKYKANNYLLNNDNLIPYDLIPKNIILDDDIIYLYTELNSNTKSSNKC